MNVAVTEGMRHGDVFVLTQAELRNVVARETRVLLSRIAEIGRRSDRADAMASFQRRRAELWKSRWSDDHGQVTASRNWTFECGQCGERIVP